ncbi:MAG: hypothetical protein D6729_05005 [Deltaproteobacteria bacterium]|nr:MAG: hypothetical protein D6729_05005 [Deltaproteobacteria bacterium]
MLALASLHIVLCFDVWIEADPDGDTSSGAPIESGEREGQEGASGDRESEEPSGRHRERRVYVLRPAEPTLDVGQVLSLVRIKLEASPLPGPVRRAELIAEAVSAKRGQLGLFFRGRRRDLREAGRALARLRAEVGEGSVVRAELRDAHLPEARFEWKPIAEVRRPRPGRVEGDRPLVRRMGRGFQLQEAPEGEREAGLGGGVCIDPALGAIDQMWGPFTVSGGWWATEVHREYYYAETKRGDLLWLYYDRARRRWILQGKVE